MNFFQLKLRNGETKATKNDSCEQRQALCTKIKTYSFHLHIIYENSSEDPDYHSVLSRRIEALIRQR